MEFYKNYQIIKSDYATGYYEAINLEDCDAFIRYGKNVKDIKEEIDNEGSTR